MNEEEKKSLKILIIVLVIFLLISLILVFLKNNNQKASKAIDGYEYILEKETAYSNDENKGYLPLINLKGSEIEEINNEIIVNYYDIVNSEYDTFTYEYLIYKDVLSLFITITKFDDSEYGDINYYAYNINTLTNKRLSNEELFEYLELDKNDIKDKIDSKIKKYYLTDDLKNTVSLDDYKKTLNYDYEKVSFVIKDKKLYGYLSLLTTQSLLNFQGNINEFELMNLK